MQRRWKRSSFNFNWRDGFEIRHRKFTTFVRIPSNPLQGLDSLIFSVRLLAMTIMFGTLWVFVPKKRTNLNVETIGKQASTVYQENFDDL